MPPRRPKILIAAAAALALAVCVVGVLAAFPDTTVGYLARAGWFQAEQLRGRVPLDDPSVAPALTPAQRDALALVPEIRDYADAIGLGSAKSYTSINPTWNRTIWNVSACEPLAFRPLRWTFPVVGSVPYLGYFRLEDARRRGDGLEAQGYDVMVRPAGAYSTLGWFADPILPTMLTWDEARLADTLLHESTHATLWIPGSVAFNESFANFVGGEAALGYLIDKYGEDSEQVAAVYAKREDATRYRELMLEIHAALRAVYADKTRSDGEKLREKHLILAAIPTRIAALGLTRGDRYVAAAKRHRWNNARLVQFKVYNDHPSRFATLLEQCDGDLAVFMARVDEIAHGADDPFAALAVAVGEDPVADAESSKPIAQ